VETIVVLWISLWGVLRNSASDLAGFLYGYAGAVEYCLGGMPWLEARVKALEDIWKKEEKERRASEHKFANRIMESWVPVLQDVLEGKASYTEASLRAVEALRESVKPRTKALESALDRVYGLAQQIREKELGKQ